MKNIITFLHDLQCNNNREWFNAHKSEYIAVQTRFNTFVEELIKEISLFEPAVEGLTAKDCTYRIYRDTRFSSDKSPYKTHFGAFICRGGKKSGYSGYYFQISAGKKEAISELPFIECEEQAESWQDIHFLASGDYCCSPEVLQVIREDIMNGEGDFEHIIKHKVDAGFYLDTDNMLKRNPKGFPNDAPYSEYLRLKYFCLMHPVDTDFICAPNLAQRLAKLFQTTKPFIDYVNRAVDYVREQN